MTQTPSHSQVADETLDAIAFIGETLAPFYLEDPHTGHAGAAYDALAALDVQAASEAWPFIKPAMAKPSLESMVAGLAHGHDDEDLMWEYRRRFIGPATKPAPPWGSVYTDKDCVIFGASTLELRQWMRANGIARLSDERNPEDHIGLMLALMAWVASNKPELLEEYLRLHLLTWSTHFLDELHDAARHPFYQGLARITRDSLEGIREELGIQVAYPHFYR